MMGGMNSSRPCAVPVAAVLFLLASPAFALEGDWRIALSRAAPWATDAGAAQAMVGARFALREGRASGPGPLSCGQARVQAIVSPPEGLFQGGLPVPARDAAALGLAAVEVPGFRLECDSGSFDFHQADADTVLLALDNRILSFSRAPGALAPQDAPEARVQALLEQHFAGDMGFLADGAAAKAAWLTSELQARIDAYFARGWPDDEVPPINGDPFTDSQEYPTRFAVQAARIEGDVAEVPVRFADAYAGRELLYRLRREAGGWRIDDIDYGRGEHFSGLLAVSVD